MKHDDLAIIFDFDNTLVKSHINFPAMKISMARAASKYGLEFGDEENIPNRYTAGNIIDQVEEYDKKNDTQLADELWLMVEKFERMGMENTSIDDDVLEMLDYLKKKGISISILTNNAKKPTVEVLERFNISDYFDIVIAREDVSRMKPDKEGLEVIVKKLKLNPDKVIFVGDSWVDGVAAVNANIRFVLLRNKILDASKYNMKIWKHIQTIKELVEIIDGH
ncbi:MAG: HAD-IA family hydrolase [Candidatus Heimdallarchaeota archaeon]|nr:HAD-IA family hydrolase [Candidatus Heimdallarchaeota archaeon]MBY8995147.1 HAD-IA family hydrolase [Candidatus Heimdallarchaeota archaeon]